MHSYNFKSSYGFSTLTFFTKMFFLKVLDDITILYIEFKVFIKCK